MESVVSQYGQYVYNLALKLSANPENAEDLAQETLIKAWKHLQDINDTSAIKNWLRTICINEFRMMLRKEKRENVCFVENIEDLESDSMLLVDVQPLALDEIQTTEEVGKLRDGCFLAMTQKLSLNQRLAFSLIDMFGMSLKDVAEILELTPKAVKGLLYRARMNLDSFFQGHCSFLDINNPCKCTAWIDFLQTRNSLQEVMEQTLDYKKAGYVFDPKVRQKILHYYTDMPSQKPSQEWFDKVILLVRNFYK
ncbi:RNA polymerase sigma factor [Hungatella effluvii]|uniref:RNA polymerase sigma factor n=1 Tax=Hungatella effluvii TaxID=1096246 RepID=UPI00241C3A39|nr:sigma-70 family RNA polymerase sigma factor [Hungatella effluvii]